MNVPNGRGAGFPAEKRAEPFLLSLPLSHLPVPSVIRISENHVQNAPLSACISDPVQVHTQRLNRIGNVGSGEFSAEAENKDAGGGLRICALVVGAGAARLCCPCPPLAVLSAARTGTVDY